MTDENKTIDDLPAELAAEADLLLAEAPDVDAPTPDSAAEQNTSTDTGEMMAAVLGVTFNGVIAPRRGKHWEMDDQECGELGKAYGAVIDKYFPDLDVGVEFTAIVVTFAVLGPRIAQDVVNANADDDGDEIAEAA